MDLVIFVVCRLALAGAYSNKPSPGTTGTANPVTDF